MVTRLAMLGLTSSAIASMLAAAGLKPARAAAPAKRGASGVLKLLYWQAPTILNSHLASGTKDFHASHVCLEPLLNADAAGMFRPVLAQEVPSRANGGLAADGKSVTYRLKRDVKWADGRPFTADFYTDVEMHTQSYGSPFPATYMARYYSGDPAKDIPQKENNWSGQNICRWVSKEYNQLYDQALVELDPKKNDELWIKMNNLVVSHGVFPPDHRSEGRVCPCQTLDVGPNMTPWDSQTWNIADWRRIG